MSRIPYLDHDAPVALAHRGFSLDGRENSMAAFQAAIDLGFRYLETDVHATSDGVLIAFHDPMLDRITDSHGVVSATPWSQLQHARIHGVEPVPRFEELLDAWPQARINVDIKSPGAIAPLVRAIERAGAHDRVCVTSFSDTRRRRALQQLSAPVATAAGTRVAGAFAAAARIPGAAGVRATRRALHDVDLLQVPIRAGAVPMVTRRTVQRAHKAGVEVHVWTVNEPDQMRELLDLGVDGLVSDRADLLAEVLRERGQWPAG